jgi:hypothetical protein
MQLVEVRERVEDLVVRPKPPSAAPEPKLFAGLRKLEIMSFGVPEEWVNDVREATESSLFDLLPHLPQEAQEALLRLAVGEKPVVAEPAPAEAMADPFAHPDAQRRFRVLQDGDELRRALDFPWDRWAVFLNPAQRVLGERRFAVSQALCRSRNKRGIAEVLRNDTWPNQRHESEFLSKDKKHGGPGLEDMRDAWLYAMITLMPRAGEYHYGHYATSAA